MSIFCITYDEDSREISIYDILKRQIIVYSQEGNFIRKFSTREKETIKTINSFDKNLYLVCVAKYPKNGKPEINSYRFISKIDGSIVDTIPINFSEIVPENFMKNEGSYTTFITIGFTQTITRENDSFILADISSDTIYSITKERKLKPIFVRTPSLSETKSPLVLNVFFKTNNYLFFSKTNHDYQTPDFKRIKEKLDKVEGESYVLDLKTNKLYVEDFHNADYPDSNTSAQGFSFNEMNNDRYIHQYKSYKLIKALEEGKLSGQLKVIASGLKDDDNPVLMLIKFKSDSN